MTSEITRVFQIAFPPFLKTRYDFLQAEIDRIINDPVFRPQIDQLDPDEFYLSNYYRELKKIVNILIKQIGKQVIILLIIHHGIGVFWLKIFVQRCLLWHFVEKSILFWKNMILY